MREFQNGRLAAEASSRSGGGTTAGGETQRSKSGGDRRMQYAPDEEGIKTDTRITESRQQDASWRREAVRERKV